MAFVLSDGSIVPRRRRGRIGARVSSYFGGVGVCFRGVLWCGGGRVSSGLGRLDPRKREGGEPGQRVCGQIDMDQYSFLQRSSSPRADNWTPPPEGRRARPGRAFSALCAAGGGALHPAKVRHRRQRAVKNLACSAASGWGLQQRNRETALPPHVPRR